MYVIASQPSHLDLIKWEMLDWIEPTSWSHCKPQYPLVMHKNLCETVIAIMECNKCFSLAMSPATISDVFYIVLYYIPAHKIYSSKNCLVAVWNLKPNDNSIAILQLGLESNGTWKSRLISNP